MSMHDLNCTRLDEKLADYLEGDLAAGERVALEAHIASCVRCTALVRDLQHIRSEAGGLAELTPSRDLWSGIAERIETPVVPLTVRAATTPNVDRRRRSDRLRLAAVAAALVAVTAGVTYTLTVSRGGTTADSTQVAVGSDASNRDSTSSSSAVPQAPARRPRSTRPCPRSIRSTSTS